MLPIGSVGGFISLLCPPPHPVLQYQRPRWEPPLTGRPPSLVFSSSSCPSFLIFTFISRYSSLLYFVRCRMWDLVARRQSRLPGRFCCFLDNQTRAATDEQPSYRLWEGNGGLFWALQRVCVGVWRWNWEPVRVVANLSTRLLF